MATGSFGTVPGLLLLPYLTDSLGVAAGLAGLIVFAPKAWDVLLNPITGRVSDRLTARGGTRRPLLIVGGSALAVCFALLFAGPQAPPGPAAVWVVVLFLASATAYSVFQVPYVALPAEMTDDYGERTRLLGWRVAVLAVAILVSGGAAPLLRDVTGGYAAVGAFVAGLIAVGTLGAWLGTRGIRPTPFPPPAAGLATQLRLAWRVRDFRLLLITFVVQALAVGALLAGVDYVARVVLGRPGASSILFACFVGPALITMPLWQRLAARRGKRTGYVISSLVLAAGAFGLLAVAVAPIGVTFAAAALAGIGYAGCQLFPLAMLPDTAAHDARATGENRIGVFTGVWTAGETLGLALGPAVFAVVLSLGGYVSSTVATTQSDSALTAIVLGFGLLPGVCVLLSLLALRGYRLRAQDLVEGVTA